MIVAIDSVVWERCGYSYIWEWMESAIF